MDNKLFECFIPVGTVSESNMRDHWRSRHRRSKSQKQAVQLFFTPSLGSDFTSIDIILTRQSAGILDTDNLPGSLKAIRDAVADVLIPGLAPGRADGDVRLRWIYEQKRDPEIGVRVQILPRSRRKRDVL